MKKYLMLVIVVALALSGCGMIGEKSKSNSDSPKEMKEPISYLQKEGYQGKVKRVTERQADSGGKEIITVVEISPEGKRISEKRIGEKNGQKVEEVSFFDHKEREIKKTKNGTVVEEKNYDDAKGEYSGFSETKKIVGKLNKIGLPIEETITDDVKKIVAKASYTYDENGNRIVSKKRENEAKHQYDFHNREIKLEVIGMSGEKTITSSTRIERNQQGWLTQLAIDVRSGEVRREALKSKVTYSKVDAKGNWVESIVTNLLTQKEPSKTTRTIEYYE